MEIKFLLPTRTYQIILAMVASLKLNNLKYTDMEKKRKRKEREREGNARVQRECICFNTF